MTIPNARAKVSAVLWLAGGKSQAAAAEAAGVSPSTISTWRKDPVFAAEVEATRLVYEHKPQDGAALMARLDEAEKRLTPATPSASGPRTVQVRVRPGESKARVRERVARAIGRDVARQAVEVLKAADL